MAALGTVEIDLPVLVVEVHRYGIGLPIVSTDCKDASPLGLEHLDAVLVGHLLLEPSHLRVCHSLTFLAPLAVFRPLCHAENALHAAHRNWCAGLRSAPAIVWMALALAAGSLDAFEATMLRTATVSATAFKERQAALP